MPEPFRFLDRVDALLEGPASLFTSVRAAVLPGGDRPVTRASDASRIPEADVRRHVTEVALDLLRERLRPGLVAALEEHLAAVREEHEMLEGPEPKAEDRNVIEWTNSLRETTRLSFVSEDSPQYILQMQEVLPCAEELADVALAAPVDDPGAVLARAGVTPGAVDALVAEIRRTKVLSDDGEFVVSETIAPLVTPQPPGALIDGGWSLERLADQVRYAVLMQGEEVAREAVTYVLTEPDLLVTGAEILGLDGDEAFLAWAARRGYDSGDDAIDVETVMGLALEGGALADFDVSSGLIDGDGMQGNELLAAQLECICPGKGEGIRAHLLTCPLSPKYGTYKKPAPAEESDLTRAVGAALAALYDHGCETDKAMAETLGVQKSVVNAARHGRAPWVPEDATVRQLYDMISAHEGALARARDGLEAFT